MVSSKKKRVNILGREVSRWTKRRKIKAKKKKWRCPDKSCTAHTHAAPEVLPHQNESAIEEDLPSAAVEEEAVRVAGRVSESEHESESCSVSVECDDETESSSVSVECDDESESSSVSVECDDETVSSSENLHSDSEESSSSVLSCEGSTNMSTQSLASGTVTERSFCNDNTEFAEKHSLEALEIDQEQDCSAFVLDSKDIFIDSTESPEWQMSSTAASSSKDTSNYMTLPSDAEVVGYINPEQIIGLEIINRFKAKLEEESHQSVESNINMDLQSDSENDDDLIMYYLEEEPQENDLQHNNNNIPERRPDMDPPDDDPDDPIDGYENDNHDNDDEEDNNANTFSFDDPSLNLQLRFGQHGCTLREALLINVATSVKHHWTYEALVDSLAGWGVALGRGGVFPSTKKQLWRLLNKSDGGFVKYAYCPACHKYHGKYNDLVADVIHCDCNTRTPREKMPFFVSLSLRKQLKHFLAIPGIGRLLQYRRTRRKHREHSIEDIFDGEVYRGLLENGTLSPNDFTYTFNTDGFKLFKTMSVWGLLIRLNDLPPNLRQRHLFLAAVWLDKKEPTMNTFMRPFVQEANILSRNGVVWRPEGVEEVRSKFLPICCCVDAVARAKVMNQHQFNGQHGCFLCTHSGIELAGSMKYPNLPFGDLPPAQERTHQYILDSMLENRLIEGQKGPSEVMFLNHFDMGIKGNAMDDLHPFYEGIGSFLMDLLETVLGNNADASFTTVDVRMKNVRTPVQMARKWLSFKKRSSWKGSQWGYFIKYHAVPCFLENNLPVRHLEHLSMLSYIMFVFSRDSIAPEEFQRASEYAERFLQLFEEYHGPENMRFNVHMLKHVAQSRREWGGSWTVSTFNFESWNFQLGQCVTSTKGVVDQIVDRHFLKMYAHTAVHRDDISERVRNQISHLLFASERKLAVQVEPDILALGRAQPVLATAEEELLLRRAGINGRNLVMYERILMEGIEFRCCDYHIDTRSNNSVAFTWNDNFVTIKKIVVIEENGQNVCGMFVDSHVVRYPLRFAHHIAEVIRSEDAFLRANLLRVPAIKMIVRDITYIVPMSNCHEID